MKTIPLTQNKQALVDDADYEAASQFKWYAFRGRHSWYARRVTPAPNRKAIYLHRFILGLTNDQHADHKNGNGLDCQRANLRIASYAENARNARQRQDNSSGYIGVSLHPRRLNRPWHAAIKLNGRTINLGYFATAEEAAAIRDKAALKYHGQFAALNYCR